MAKLAINATDIVASIQNSKLIFDPSGLAIKNGGFTIFGENNEKVFYVNKEGNLFFKGELDSNAGNLGGWKISSDGLYSTNKQVGLYAGNERFLTEEDSKLNNPIRIWAGKTGDSYLFAVTEKGTLYANDAEIKGKISATGGRIENDILVGKTDNGILISGNAEGQSYISSAQYRSGSVGYGWKISDDGSANFDNVTVRGKIQSSVFEYNKVSAVGGSLYISPTISFETVSSEIKKLTTEQALQEDEDTSLKLQNYQVSWIISKGDLTNYMGSNWEKGDRIKVSGQIITGDKKLIEINGADGYINTKEVDSDKNQTTLNIVFSIYENQDIINTISYFQPGAIIISLGTNANKRGIYLTSQEANSPYIDVFNYNENQDDQLVRIGDLSGIIDTNFETSNLTGYGLYSTNAYLKGKLMLPSAGITNQNDILYKDSPIRIWAGTDQDAMDEASFIVTEDGSLYASKGIFSGIVKATDGEFSGIIKAAGIVIDKGSDDNIKNDHFFVAYNNNPTSFDDYVLDIGAHGLSIWEGGLKAYSDYASGQKEGFKDYSHPIYDYHNSNPMPYFNLADDIQNKELGSRFVAYKGHILTIEEIENEEKFKTNSIIFNNGIWFNQSFETNLTNIEQTIFYENSKENGIFYEDLLNFNSNKGFSFKTSNTFYINATSEDKNKETSMETLFIRGQVKIVNDENINLINLNNQSIEEAKDENGNSIGINIVIQ